MILQRARVGLAHALSDFTMLFEDRMPLLAIGPNFIDERLVALLEAKENIANFDSQGR